MTLFKRNSERASLFLLPRLKLMASRCASLSRSLMLLPSGLCACGQLVFSSHWSMIIAVCAVSTLGFCGLQFLLWVLCLSCISVCMQSACASLLLSAGLCACRQQLEAITLWFSSICAVSNLGFCGMQCVLWVHSCSCMGCLRMLPARMRFSPAVFWPLCLQAATWNKFYLDQC